MATQKGDDTHVLVECADDLFSLHSDRIQPKAQHRRRILSQGALSTKILCAFGVLLVLVTAISMGTLAVSLYALRISEKLGASREWDNEKFLQQEESDRNTLFQVHNFMHYRCGCWINLTQLSTDPSSSIRTQYAQQHVIQIQCNLF